MSLLAKDHPIWRLALNLCWLSAALVLTASDFDASELKTLGLFMAGNGLIDKLTK